MKKRRNKADEIERFIRHELRDGPRSSLDVQAAARAQGINEYTLAEYAPRWRSTRQVAGRHEWYLLEPDPVVELRIPERGRLSWPHPNINPNSLSDAELLRMLGSSDDPLVNRLLSVIRATEEASDGDDEVNSAVGDATDSNRDYEDGYVTAMLEVEVALFEIEKDTLAIDTARQAFDRVHDWLNGKRKGGT